MNNLKEYLIPFIGLKIGKHQFDYQLDNTFFAHFDYDEFKQFYKFSQIQTSQTYSDTFPPTIASVLCPVYKK